MFQPTPHKDTASSLVMRARHLGELCERRQVAIAVAESCTGGSLGACMSSSPGSSRWFIGGIICYHEALKVELLGVDQALIAESGVVSEAVVKAMSTGLSRHFPHALCLALTGWLNNTPQVDASTGRVLRPPNPVLDRIYPPDASSAVLGGQENIFPGNVWMSISIPPTLSGSLTESGEHESRARNISVPDTEADRALLQAQVCGAALDWLIEYLSQSQA